MEDDGVQVVTVRFRGKIAVAVLAVFLAVIAACVVNVRGVSPDDDGIMETLKSSLQTKHIRTLSGDIKKHMEAGEMEKAAELGSKIAGSRINIESLEIAYPAIQHIAGKRDVVAKVIYSITVQGETGESRTEYYEMHKMLLGGSWLCSGQVGKLYYYINMINDDD